MLKRKDGDNSHSQDCSSCRWSACSSCGPAPFLPSTPKDVWRMNVESTTWIIAERLDRKATHCMEVLPYVFYCRVCILAVCQKLKAPTKLLLQLKTMCTHTACQLQMEIHVKFIASMLLCTLLCSLVGTLLNLIHLPFPFSLSSLVSQLHLYPARRHMNRQWPLKGCCLLWGLCVAICSSMAPQCSKIRQMR